MLFFSFTEYDVFVHQMFVNSTFLHEVYHSVGLLEPQSKYVYHTCDQLLCLE